MNPDERPVAPLPQPWASSNTTSPSACSRSQWAAAMPAMPPPITTAWARIWPRSDGRLGASPLVSHSTCCFMAARGRVGPPGSTV